MITQAGGRPSSVSSTIRRSIASASLNGTATVIRATESGMPAPYGRDSPPSCSRFPETPTIT
jgi:hypothetical protein